MMKYKFDMVKRRKVVAYNNYIVYKWIRWQKKYDYNQKEISYRNRSYVNQKLFFVCG